jgi:hypothetical protein
VVDVSGQLQALFALSPGGDFPNFMKYGTLWSPQPVWMLQTRENLIPRPAVQTPFLVQFSP